MKTTKLKNGSVSARVYLGSRNGKEIVKRITASTPKELRKKIQEEKYLFTLEKKAETGKDLTLRQCFEQYIETHENIFSPSTIQGYKVIVRNSFQDLMDKNINDITEMDIQAEINSMASNLSFKTISSRYSLFVCSVAPYRREVKNWHPKMPPKKKAELYIPTKEDVEALISYAEKESPEMVLPIMLGAFCGLRRGEIASLTFADIHDGAVHISKAIVNTGGRVYQEKAPKSYAGFRSVPLSPRVEQFIEERKKSSEKLISVDLEAITDRFSHIVKNAGVHPMRFHDLRHFFASQLVLLGIPDIYAIKLTGHSTTNMLRNVYQHTFKEAEDLFRQKLVQSL